MKKARKELAKVNEIDIEHTDDEEDGSDEDYDFEDGFLVEDEESEDEEDGSDEESEADEEYNLQDTFMAATEDPTTTHQITRPNTILQPTHSIEPTKMFDDCMYYPNWVQYQFDQIKSIGFADRASAWMKYRGNALSRSKFFMLIRWLMFLFTGTLVFNICPFSRNTNKLILTLLLVNVSNKSKHNLVMMLIMLLVLCMKMVMTILVGMMTRQKILILTCLFILSHLVLHGSLAFVSKGSLMKFIVSCYNLDHYLYWDMLLIKSINTQLCQPKSLLVHVFLLYSVQSLYAKNMIKLRRIKIRKTTNQRSLKIIRKQK